MSVRIYLDNNASTFLDPRVHDHIIQTLQVGGNPSSIHVFGQKARNVITKTRGLVASFLGVKASEIIFTSSGTESAAMIIRGVMSLAKGGHLITSAAEHSCVYILAKQLEKEGHAVSFLPTGSWGAVQPDAVLAAITPETKLIALTAVNNETGVKTDIHAIAEIAASRKISFFVDGVALLGKEPFAIPEGVTAMGFSGHKIHALPGSGFAFIRTGLKLKPLMHGGEQEFGRRPGTENLLGIAAIGKAIEILSAEQKQASAHMLRMRERFEELLIAALPTTLVNGEGPRISNVSNLYFSGVDGETLLINLDGAGIAASHGSACSSGSLEPSRILLNMGLPLERVRSSLRFSFSRLTTKEEIEEACSIIIRSVNKMRRI